MFKKVAISLMVALLIIAAPAAAKKGASGGCKSDAVTGSYVRIIDGSFTDGDGDFHARIWVRHLNLNAGGTAHQDETSGPDVMINFGKRAQWLGSWVCREDGQLLVTAITALYAPVPPDEYFPGSVDDLALRFHFRTTYLFSVVDDDNLSLVQAQSRRYDMSEDPSDGTQGTLLTEFFGNIPYKRLVPTDADLTP